MEISSALLLVFSCGTCTVHLIYCIYLGAGAYRLQRGGVSSLHIMSCLEVQSRRERDELKGAK